MTNKQIEKDILYLIYCSLHQVVPETSRVLEMDLEELFRYAKSQTLDAITYMALEKVEQLPDVECLAKWKERRLKAFRKNLMLDTERKNLFSFMDQNNIWYMPLKGSILKDFYPKQEMRQMSDNDILFDKAFQKEVRDYFAGRGYEVVSYAKGNHDVYEKAPVYNYEMHTSLFNATHNIAWKKYYINVKERLIKNESGAGYHFSDEDFYVYFVVHAYKHYNGSGTGIRSFVDSYVYQISKKLDWKYIEEEMKKLEIVDFEKAFRKTAFIMFEAEDGIEKLTEEEYKFVQECMHVGTYGTQKNAVKKRIQKLQNEDGAFTRKTKWKYYLSRLFPSMEFYETYYPTIYKHKILIPFYIIYRLFRGVFRNGKRLFKEAMIVWKMDK